LPEAAARGSLTRRLVIGAMVTAVAVAVVVTLLVRSTLGVHDAQEEVDRSTATIERVTRAERLVVDLETGLRAYIFTGERRFLAPFEVARTEAPIVVAELRDRAADPAQRRRAEAVLDEIDAYVRVFAAEYLGVRRIAPATQRQAIEVATQARLRLETPRADLAVYGANERDVLARRSEDVDERAQALGFLGLLSLVALVALVLGLALFVHRTVLVPVRRVAEAVERIRGGDLTVRLNQGGPAEIARLGGAIDELARSLAESRERLEVSTMELRRMSDRNLLVLDSVFSQTPAGLALFDRELRYVRVNAAQARLSGHPVETHLGRHASEIAPDIAPQTIPYMQHVLRTGKTVEVEVRGETAAEPGVERIFAVTYYPLREEGEVTGVGAVVLDVTDRRRAEGERELALRAERIARQAAEDARARAAFLADAGAVLDASLDLDETLETLAHLCVPRVADWCSFDLAEAGGRIRNAAVAHTDPAQVELARELQRRYPPDAAATTGVPAVIRTGRAELHAEISRELLLAGARSPEHLEVLEEIGLESAMIVPLTARGETFGAISFVSSESGRHFGADDFALAQDLANRAALALDNARLYRERSHVARTLQASLLPEALPDIPGVRIAARYEPLGSATEVGGDFYDVFPTGDEQWAIVIGDVCGKGAEAAALTALARYTLRAVSPAPPVEALTRLNDAILRQRNDLRFITLVYAVLDLSDGRRRLTLASGGHPPPLLVHPEGPGEVIACRGTLIGVTPDIKLTECSVDLGPGDTIAFYTDGVTESSHTDPLDGDQILAAMGDLHSADDVADGLQRLARANGMETARDDVAILALQVA
jgi:PAS domain S-box-containing protein